MVSATHIRRWPQIHHDYVSAWGKIWSQVEERIVSEEKTRMAWGGEMWTRYIILKCTSVHLLLMSSWDCIAHMTWHIVALKDELHTSYLHMWLGRYQSHGVVRVSPVSDTVSSLMRRCLWEARRSDNSTQRRMTGYKQECLPFSRTCVCVSACVCECVCPLAWIW